MRIFIYEYTCSQPKTQDLASSALRAEGWAMLSSILADFNAVSGIGTTTLVASDISSQLIPGECHHVDPANESDQFLELAAKADHTLVIAPEFDDILFTRCRCVEEAGGRLLGPNSQAVKLTADKLRTAEILTACGIRTPTTAIVGDDFEPDCFRIPSVCKPRYGAGSQSIFQVNTLSELSQCVAQSRWQGWAGDLVIQPLIPGKSASIAILLGPRQVLPLAPAEQSLSDDGRFHYLGGKVPLSHHYADRAANLASQAVIAFPGLAGYVGVDLVLGENPDGSDDYVIEINPRLTTSYIGLRRLAKSNLASAMLDIVRGIAVDAICWNDGEVAFDANGDVNDLHAIWEHRG